MPASRRLSARGAAFSDLKTSAPLALSLSAFTRPRILPPFPRHATSIPTIIIITPPDSNKKKKQPTPPKNPNRQRRERGERGTQPIINPLFNRARSSLDATQTAAAGPRMPAGGYGVLLLKRWLVLVACLRLFSGAFLLWGCKRVEVEEPLCSIN